MKDMELLEILYRSAIAAANMCPTAAFDGSFAISDLKAAVKEGLISPSEAVKQARLIVDRIERMIQKDKPEGY